MVVHLRALNFSSTESSASNLSTNVSVRDTLVPQDTLDLSRQGHTVVAVCLGLILVLGFFNNLLVLLIFAKFRSLWTPINLVLLNISVSDILVCICGTLFSFAASLQGRWLIGHHGCKWYGFANSLFGIVSLLSLSILSYERYATVQRSTQADVSDFRKAWLCVWGSWLYSLLWTLPPFMGWSSYGPEGAGTSCSVQWTQRSPASVSYVVCLFIFCLLLPLMIMVYSYGGILVSIRGVAKINLLSAQRREQHILLMVLSMVSCYLLCWMPYGVMALAATFGRSGLVTPVASVVPAVLAKSSTVINPVIYVLFNNQFYRCFVAFVRCRGEPQSVYGFNTQQSSREENATPGKPLSCPSLAPKQPSLCSPHTESYRSPSNAPLCGLRRERRTMSLVVHYTP
ncbi:teleost multiple tissue opsin 3a [Oncorhynchus clarkii lewisi]|uniref:teleost multiple tissue opsin 3a n=1 Tax=Oncorhynchus clarkii lewisi TaxID=490388 RepID=UPI0039B9A95B